MDLIILKFRLIFFNLCTLEAIMESSLICELVSLFSLKSIKRRALSFSKSFSFDFQKKRENEIENPTQKEIDNLTDFSELT